MYTPGTHKPYLKLYNYNCSLFCSVRWGRAYSAWWCPDCFLFWSADHSNPAKQAVLCHFTTEELHFRKGGCKLGALKLCCAPITCRVCLAMSWSLREKQEARLNKILITQILCLLMFCLSCQLLRERCWNIPNITVALLSPFGSPAFAPCIFKVFIGCTHI